MKSDGILWVLPVLWLALAGLPSSAGGQDSSCQLDVTVTGCVRNTVTGEPVENARVCLNDFCGTCLIEPWFCGLCEMTDPAGCVSFAASCTVSQGEGFPNLFRVTIYATGYESWSREYVWWIAPPCTGSEYEVFPIDFGQVHLTPTTCCRNRGNINGVDGGTIGIADVTYLAAYMFKSGPEPPCLDEADCDDSGSIDIVDLNYLVAYMFKSGPAPAECP